MSTSSNIVTFLRSHGIEPIATSKNEAPFEKADISYVLDYERSLGYYFRTTGTTDDEWYKVNLKKRFYLNSYNILGQSYCNWVQKWKIEISLDDKTWYTVDTYGTKYSDNITKVLGHNYLVQYVKITGSAPLCTSGVPKRLAFQRLYLYGIVAPGLRTCQKNIFLQSGIVTCLLIFFFS